MKISPTVVYGFQKKILVWYAENKRDLPWREVPDGTSLQKRAYRVHVSEVMLQQTQVSRVIPKYEAWLTAFPTIKDLANASARDVLLLWSGLGYNRRALRLQKAAREIVAKYGNGFPNTTSDLNNLPGIGEYTAAAIACFAFNKQIAVIDTNVRKVISLEFFNAIPPDEKTLHVIATQLLPSGKASIWNQALMDYSAIMLKKEKIPLVKQSRFIGSDRYYRGRIIKLLLVHSSLTLAALGKGVKEDFLPSDTAWFLKIVDKMVKEELLISQNGFLALKA